MSSGAPPPGARLMPRTSPTFATRSTRFRLKNSPPATSCLGGSLSRMMPQMTNVSSSGSVTPMMRSPGGVPGFGSGEGKEQGSGSWVVGGGEAGSVWLSEPQEGRQTDRQTGAGGWLRVEFFKGLQRGEGADRPWPSQACVWWWWGMWVSGGVSFFCWFVWQHSSAHKGQSPPSCVSQHTAYRPEATQKARDTHSAGMGPGLGCPLCQSGAHTPCNHFGQVCVFAAQADRQKNSRRQSRRHNNTSVSCGWAAWVFERVWGHS